MLQYMDPRLGSARGFLFDVDGTLLEDGRLLPGACDAVRAVRAAGLGVRFVTNTSRRPRREVVEALRSVGLPVEPEEVLTAPVACASWLAARGARRVALFVAEPAHEDFADFERMGPEPGVAASRAERPLLPAPDAVVVGDLGRRWSYELLDRAFSWLLEGARLVAIQRNRYWRTGGQLHLDAGPFVAALEYASGQTAVITGKPSPPFFEEAARSLGLAPREVAMVGDDLEADVTGARDVGAIGILVRTGKFREEELERARTHPDAILDSVAGLPGLLGT